MNLDAFHNDKFSVDVAEARLTPVLNAFFQMTSRDGFSLSAEDLRQITESKDRALDLIARTFGAIREQALERRQNLEAFSGVEFMSIGEDCFSRTILTRWGLKKFARLGEKSGPFDLSVHGMASTIELLETDFADYLDPRHLAFIEKHNYCVNRKYAVHFNHETGPAYAEQDFAPLIERYRARLAHFGDVMASDRPTALVYHGCHPEASPPAERFARLWDALAARWGAANKLLICVNTWPHGTEIVPTPSPEPDSVVMVDIAYPEAGYLWHLPKHCFSEAGVGFERRVVDFVKGAAVRLIQSIALAVAVLADFEPLLSMA